MSSKEHTTAATRVQTERTKADNKRKEALAKQIKDLQAKLAAFDNNQARGVEGKVHAPGAKNEANAIKSAIGSSSSSSSSSSNDFADAFFNIEI